MSRVTIRLICITAIEPSQSKITAAWVAPVLEEEPTKRLYASSNNTNQVNHIPSTAFRLLLLLGGAIAPDTPTRGQQHDDHTINNSILFM